MAGQPVRRRRRFAPGWVLLALAAAAIPAWLTVTTVGECRDSSDPALSTCTSGPALGEAGTVVLWGVWAVFAVWCLWRAVRPAGRRSVGTPHLPAPSDGSVPRTGAHTSVEIALPPRGAVRMHYAPNRNGRPDAGEVVWAWVPFQEDPTRGKDRPLLVIARHDAQHLLAMKLTSKPRDHDRAHVGIGTGPWDPQGRPSWIDVEQIYRIHHAGIRREAAPAGRAVFDRVARVLVDRYGWITVD